MKQYPFEYAALISEGEDPYVYQGLPVHAQEWFTSAKIRGCQYDGVDWNTIAPLDPELMLQMQDAEAVFMDTVARLEWKRSIPYAVRKQWYLRHLQFWDDYITRHKINFFLSAWIPHEVPDVLLYRLCRIRGIPTLFFHTTLVQDVSYAASTWEDPAPRFKEGYQELIKRYANIKDPNEIPLEPMFEERYQSLVREKAEQPKIEGIRRKTELDKVKDLFWRKPLQFFRFGFQYLSPRGLQRIGGMWQRRNVIKERNAFYDAHAVEPDMTKPFVYLPLHFQPEASTAPMAGVFTDQILVAQMLNAFLPEDVLIYVKEHPRESAWVKRSKDDYADFLSIKKVRLIARKVDTFALREKCKAVATCSGSAGFEAIFRGKPVFLFGSRFYQYVQGVFRIRSNDDCKHAVHAVFAEGAAPTAVGARIVMKTMEETGVRALLHPLHLHVSNFPPEVHIENNTKAIVAEIRALEPEILAATKA